MEPMPQLLWKTIVRSYLVTPEGSKVSLMKSCNINDLHRSILPNSAKRRLYWDEREDLG
jgi:hypothetical protein